MVGSMLVDPRVLPNIDPILINFNQIAFGEEHHPANLGQMKMDMIF